MMNYQQPDVAGHFGPYGGSFVSETLTHAIQQLREAYARYRERVPGLVPWPGRSLSADEARALCASPRRAVKATTPMRGSDTATSVCRKLVSRKRACRPVKNISRRGSASPSKGWVQLN